MWKINEVLSTTKILQRLSHTHCLIDDLGMNVLAWTLSQFQGERIQAYSTEALLGAYDWERLLRWRSRGPESLGVMVSSPRIISLTDAWVWFLWYPPCSNDPYRYKNGILELPWSNGRTPLGIGLDETNELCACFSAEVPRGTIIEHLDVDCLPSHPTDLDIYHPFQYPDLNLNVTLDVTTPGGSLLRYAQDGKNWNRYNACYVYRHHQLNLITIRNVERGEKLLLPKGAAHWQGHEEGLLHEYTYAVEPQKGGGVVSLAERYESFRCFRMETGMESTLIPYQDWTTELLQLNSCMKGESPDDIDYDMKCFLYFRSVMGVGVNLDSQGACVRLDKDERSFPPYGPD